MFLRAARQPLLLSTFGGDVCKCRLHYPVSETWANWWKLLSCSAPCDCWKILLGCHQVDRIWVKSGEGIFFAILTWGWKWYAPPLILTWLFNRKANGFWLVLLSRPPTSCLILVPRSSFCYPHLEAQPVTFQAAAGEDSKKTTLGAERFFVYPHPRLVACLPASLLPCFPACPIWLRIAKQRKKKHCPANILKM